MKFLLSLIIAAIVGFTLTEGYQFYLHLQTKLQVKKQIAVSSHFSLSQAPTNSEIGQITLLAGTVKWESRTATQEAVIHATRLIQQGEELSTGANGQASMSFGNATSVMTLFPNTDLSVIQTLPQNIVIDQEDGQATYTDTGSTPIAIKSMNLLLELADGSINVVPDPIMDTVTISVQKGSATAAFDDSTETSNVVPIPAGTTFEFDNDSLTYTTD